MMTELTRVRVGQMPEGLLTGKQIVKPSRRVKISRLGKDVQRTFDSRVGEWRIEVTYGPTDERGFKEFGKTTMIPGLNLLQSRKPVAVSFGGYEGKGTVIGYSDEFRGFEGLYVVLKVLGNGPLLKQKQVKHARRPKPRHR